jgi:hypothetical protein
LSIVVNVPVSGWGSWGGSSHRRGTQHASVQLTDNTSFLTENLGNPKRLHYVSRSELHIATKPEERYRGGELIDMAEFMVPAASLAVQAIHRCFAAHEPLSLRPDTVWYFITHQVAEYVRQNSSTYTHLFTDTPDTRQIMRVRDDSLRYDEPSDWMRTIDLFTTPLRDRLAEGTAELFLPHFSTTTVEDEAALLVSLMDAASPFYDYQVKSMCGIPKIRLEGDATDWQQLYRQAEAMAGTFRGLSDYFTALLPVLGTIAETAAGGRPDEHFWSSIYNENHDSGTHTISGWITAFFAYRYIKEGQKLRTDFGVQRGRHQYSKLRLNHLPSHLTKVPFIWDYFGRLIPMSFIGGVLGVDHHEHFFVPRLGFAVAED